jgi:hypothetical protein
MRRRSASSLCEQRVKTIVHIQASPTRIKLFKLLSSQASMPLFILARFRKAIAYYHWCTVATASNPSIAHPDRSAHPRPNSRARLARGIKPWRLRTRLKTRVGSPLWTLSPMLLARAGLAQLQQPERGPVPFTDPPSTQSSIPSPRRTKGRHDAAPRNKSEIPMPRTGTRRRRRRAPPQPPRTFTCGSRPTAPAGSRHGPGIISGWSRRRRPRRRGPRKTRTRETRTRETRAAAQRLGGLQAAHGSRSGRSGPGACARRRGALGPKAQERPLLQARTRTAGVALAPPGPTAPGPAGPD